VSAAAGVRPRRASANPVSLKARAIQWLAQREHSRSELRSKLLRAHRAMLRLQAEREQRAQLDSPGPVADVGAADAASARGEAAATVDALLDWLAAHGYLSEARFVESRVHARQARHGNLRIRQELQQHGLSLDAAAQEALKGSELQRAHAVWLRKFGQAAPTEAPDAAARAKQMRFLAGRGFTPEVIRRVVRGALDDDDV